MSCKVCNGDGWNWKCDKCGAFWNTHSSHCKKCGCLDCYRKKKECSECKEKPDSGIDDSVYNDGRGIDWDNDLHTHWTQ